VVSDIQAIADVVHAYGSILIVDEAHGAHFPFSDAFPRSAIECGADIVIQSMHKTLPSLTQTALLHRNSERVGEKQLQRYLSVFQSSSPSYVLLSSIERCLNFVTSSNVVFEGYLKILDDFYYNTRDLMNLCIWQPSEGSNIFRKDKTKLIIYAKNGVVSGTWIYETLLKTYLIQAEMAMKDYVVCLSSVCDTKEGFGRLCIALHEMDQQITTLNNYKLTNLKAYLGSQSEKILSNELVVLLPKVEEYERDTKPLIECEGEVSAEYIYLYPPGIPIVVPGERISKALIEQLKVYQLAGLSLRGMTDHTGMVLEVLQGHKYAGCGERHGS
jgi:arginine/lysine/ornithine decarboxylase